ncbi:MAG: hypothetical protein ACRCTF_05015 [Bacteroidales bacterium]
MKRSIGERLTIIDKDGNEQEGKLVLVGGVFDIYETPKKDRLEPLLIGNNEFIQINDSINIILIE